MDNQIFIEPMTIDAFAPFGDVIDASEDPTSMINNGMCARHNDLARLDFEQGGRAGISIFQGRPYSLPHTVPLVERHPLGSQAFIPMSDAPFLVIVAIDVNGSPDAPQAFITQHQQGVNIHRGVWHGVLTPLNESARFAVIDWIGNKANLQEHHFESPWLISFPI